MANRPNDPHLDLDPLGLGEETDEEKATERHPVAVVTKQLAEDQSEFIQDHRPKSPAEAQAAAAMEIADPSIAAAFAAMQREIEQLRAQQRQLQEARDDEDDGGPGGFPYMYYKRPDDGGPMSGWIVVANGGASPRSGGRDVGTYANMLSKGFKPLPRYGVVSPPSGWGKRGQVYRTLISNGGAKDVPASQVLALKWHIDPPVPGTVFPQYERVKHEALTFECDEGDCGVSFSFLPADQTSAGACLDHLRGRHGYKWDEARAALIDQGIEYRTGRVRTAVAEAKARIPRALLELDEDVETS